LSREDLLHHMDAQRELTITEVRRALVASQQGIQRDLLLRAPAQHFNWTCTTVSTGVVDFFKLVFNLAQGDALFFFFFFFFFFYVSFCLSLCISWDWSWVFFCCRRVDFFFFFLLG
jgi:hypothetical protein